MTGSYDTMTLPQDVIDEFAEYVQRPLPAEAALPWSVAIVDAKHRIICRLAQSEEADARKLVERINSCAWNSMTVAQAFKPPERPGTPLYVTNVGQKLEELNHVIDLIKAEGVSSLLEVGCAFGGSLWQMANAMPKGSRVTAVDLPHFEETWVSLKDCVERLGREGYDAHLIRGDSTDAEVVEAVRSLAPFDMVFIDANHSYKFVEQDWKNYGMMGRIVAFHDIAWECGPGMEVPRFWDELKQNYRHEEYCYSFGKSFGIGVLWRMT